jgi:hypothetical protein
MTKFDYDIDIKIPVALRLWKEDGTDVEQNMDLMLDSAVIQDDTLQMIFRDIDEYINTNVLRNR